MARLPRIDVVDIAQHVIQRGNNRQTCFGSESDMAAYICWLQEYAAKFSVEIHAWVLMTNHVHLLVTPRIKSGVSHMMQSLGRRYVQYYNYTYQRSGTLWEGRYKSCVVQDDLYLLECYRYIELNPVRAGMVAQPRDYSWSSYKVNIYERESAMCTPHPRYLELGQDERERGKVYREFVLSGVDDENINQIRLMTNSGMVLGSERFMDEIESLCGRRVRAKKAGRPCQAAAEE